MPTSLIKESDVDVLIIGAGPAGLMCANALAKAGVNTRIIDQRPLRVAAGQADGIQTRTIEVLQSYGLADRLLREATQLHMAAFYNASADGGIERVEQMVNGDTPIGRYPFSVTLNQGAIEAIFLDSMLSMGVRVDRPIIPVSIELLTDEAQLKDPQSYPVKVVLKHLDIPEGKGEREIVHAKFVVGADGAHSWVRKSFGITMEGEQTEHIWGVLDIVPETDFPDIRIPCSIHSINGSSMVIPREGDLVRLYLQLTDTDVVDGTTGRLDKSKMGPERLLEVARKSFAPFTISTSHEIDWWTLYIIGQRVATQFSVHERVFIVGDACHTHSPKAGQGMNASMNDAHNLAWKITHVLRGWSNMSLLKTYEFERRRFAQELIDFDKKFSDLYSAKPWSPENQNGVKHEEFLQLFRASRLFVSGVGVHYQPSVIVNPEHQSCARNLIVGQRMLPHVFVRAADARPFEVQDLLPADTRFKVIVFAGDTTDETQRARVRALAEEMGRRESFLVRFSRGSIDTLIDVFAIVSATKKRVNYTDVPELFRSHWSKVLVDNMDMHQQSGGGGYKAYGIDSQGAVVVVRPDGYVGVVAPFEHIRDVDDYFSSFMLA